jgi:hypothetical protein
MAYVDKASTVLRNAEQELRSIITEAVAAEDYKEVVTIARIAEAIANLARHTAPPAPEAAPVIGKLIGPDWPDSIRATADEQIGMLQAVRGGKPRRESYPRFLRDGDRLVKIAWSKKERAPYEHRAPKEIVQRLIEAIRKKKGEGKKFQAADVLPIKNAVSEEYPSYQSYLALYWLREVGVVTRIGREGYMLRPNAATQQRLDGLWDALPVVNAD